MPAVRYPIVLTERLGDEVYTALVEMVDDGRNSILTAIDDRLSAMTERFERRLTEECGKLHVELAHQRAELLKWAMVFWVSQAAAVAGIVTVLK